MHTTLGLLVIAALGFASFQMLTPEPLAAPRTALAPHVQPADAGKAREAAAAVQVAAQPQQGGAVRVVVTQHGEQGASAQVGVQTRAGGGAKPRSVTAPRSAAAPAPAPAPAQAETETSQPHPAPEPAQSKAAQPAPEPSEASAEPQPSEEEPQSEPSPSAEPSPSPSCARPEGGAASSRRCRSGG